MSNKPTAQVKTEFEGGAFHPHLEKGRAAGTVRLTATVIQFDSPKGGFELPLEGLKMALGGANDRLLFFTHPSWPDATIHTADHSILDHPGLAGQRAMAAQVGQVRRKKRAALAVTLSIVLVLVGSVVGLILSKDLLVKAAAERVPVDWEVKLGDKLFEQISRSKRFIREPALAAQFAELTTPLVKGISDSRFPLKFHLVEDPTLNAFAMPGGHVVVHSGLLLAAKTPEEVAGVLAHEIAHVTKRHGFRSVMSSAGLYLLLQFFIGDTSSLLAAIADNGAFLLDRKFSRDFEREADDAGWDYLLRADIEPQGMIQFFKTMQAEEEKTLKQSPIGGAEKALTLVSTHPATEERLRTLEARWQQLDRKSGYRKIALNYDQFKDSLRGTLHSAPNQTKD